MRGTLPGFEEPVQSLFPGCVSGDTTPTCVGPRRPPVPAFCGYTVLRCSGCVEASASVVGVRDLNKKKTRTNAMTHAVKHAHVYSQAHSHMHSVHPHTQIFEYTQTKMHNNTRECTRARAGHTTGNDAALRIHQHTCCHSIADHLGQQLLQWLGTQHWWVVPWRRLVR